MATTADDTHEEPAEERQTSLLASFSQADLKLFLVTFAGTVAANIVTVLIVAVALLLARPPAGARPTATAVLLDLGAVAIGVMTIGIGVAALHRWRPIAANLRMNAVVIASLMAFMALATLAFLLVLLGYAVGVK